MKTSCFTLLLLLLLLSACCTDALSHGVSISTCPQNCCFKMSEKPVPPGAVSGIRKTHRSCRAAAFIVTTKKGRQICYDQSFLWAQKVFSQHHGQEGSTQ